MIWAILILLLLLGRKPSGAPLRNPDIGTFGTSPAPANNVPGNSVNLQQNIVASMNTVPSNPWTAPEPSIPITGILQNVGPNPAPAQTTMLTDPAIASPRLLGPPTPAPLATNTGIMPLYLGPPTTAPAPTGPGTFQGYWPGGFTHFTDQFGNAIGAGAENAPSTPAPTVVRIS